MSSFLLKNAKIIQAKSHLNNTRKDILIKKGLIKKIADSISETSAEVIESENLHVSIGWFDIGAANNEPGYEHRENLESLSMSAAAGGYTGLAIFPNTKPVIDNKSSVQFIKNSTEDHLVDYHAIGAVSKYCQGDDIIQI